MRTWAVKRHKQPTKPKKGELELSTDATKKPLLSQFSSLLFTIAKTANLICGITISAKWLQVSDRFLYLAKNVLFMFCSCLFWKNNKIIWVWRYCIMRPFCGSLKTHLALRPLCACENVNAQDSLAPTVMGSLFRVWGWVCWASRGGRSHGVVWHWRWHTFFCLPCRQSDTQMAKQHISPL